MPRWWYFLSKIHGHVGLHFHPDAQKIRSSVHPTCCTPWHHAYHSLDRWVHVYCTVRTQSTISCASHCCHFRYLRFVTGKCTEQIQIFCSHYNIYMFYLRNMKMLLWPWLYHNNVSTNDKVIMFQDKMITLSHIHYKPSHDNLIIWYWK
jgi:hypothetical protein